MKQRSDTKAQAMIEYVFSMIAMVVLIMGMMQVFFWTGNDLAARHQAHVQVLEQDVNGCSACPLEQLRPVFFISTGFDAAVDSNLFEESGFLAPPGTYTNGN